MCGEKLDVHSTLLSIPVSTVLIGFTTAVISRCAPWLYAMAVRRSGAVPEKGRGIDTPVVQPLCGAQLKMA